MPIKIIWLRLQHILPRPVGRTHCRSCGNASLYRWGVVSGMDRSTRQLRIDREYFRCTACGRLSFIRPEWIEDPRNALGRLAGLTWALGLSSDEVLQIFNGLDLPVNWSSIWEDGKELVSQLPEQRRSKLVEISGAEPRIDRAGENGVMLALELRRGKHIFLNMLYEDDPQEVQEWLDPILHRLGVKFHTTEWTVQGGTLKLPAV